MKQRRETLSRSASDSQDQELAAPQRRARPVIGPLPGQTPPSHTANHTANHAPTQIEDHRIRVLCVDDHELLIQGLKAQFSLDDSMQLVGWLESAERLIDEARAKQPHVVLLDIDMPGPDAFEMASRLHHALPHIRIIILSAHIREAFLAAVYKCGASGYFSKADHLSSLVDAIRQIANRRSGSTEDCEIVLGSKVRERCLARSTSPAWGTSTYQPDTSTPAKTKLSALSDRELEVLRLIGKGLNRYAIAKQLSRSVKTIDGHQYRIKTKLGLTAREDLMLFSIREGLAEIR